MKRQNLFAFPRIGRSDTRVPAEPETGAVSGLWFGPRLGRLQKRNPGVEYSGVGPWAVVSLRGK